MKSIIEKHYKNILIGIFFISLIFGSFFIVDPGEVGIVLRLGKIVKIEKNGIYFKLPFIDRAHIISTRISRRDVKSEAASKDLQKITTTIALNYGIKNSFADKIYIHFSDRENLEDRIIYPSTQEIFKAVTAKFTAEELITDRNIVSSEIKKCLQERVKPYGITVDEISIINFHFSKDFDKSVEEKNVAVQKALKAQRDLERIKIEAEQKIARAKAEAESLKLQKFEITDNLIKLRFIEKWDGHLPSVMGNNGVMTGMDFINK